MIKKSGDHMEAKISVFLDLCLFRDLFLTHFCYDILIKDFKIYVYIMSLMFI